MFFDALRVIDAVKPKVAIAENVKNLTSKKFAEQFKIVLDSLDFVGYNNYWAVLNAKDYGIPQNRERVFIVSIRKDIDNGAFKFPEGFPLELRLKDMLDDVVDERFYINTIKCEEIIGSGLIKYNHTEIPCIYDDRDKGFGVKTSDVCPTQRAERCGIKVMVAGRINSSQDGVVVHPEGIAPTCTAGHGNMPKVIAVGNVNPSGRGQNGAVVEGEPFIVASRGRNPKNPSDRTVGIKTEQRLEPNTQGISNALTTVQKDNLVAEPKINVIGNYSPSNHDTLRIVDSEGVAQMAKENHGTVTATVQNLRIRKLTPKECFRLMGFDDADFEKAEKVCSNTQLYKQAGNSIVVDVAEYIIKALYDCEIFNKGE